MTVMSLRRKTILGILFGVLIGCSCLIVADTLYASLPSVGRSVNETIFADLVETGISPAFDMQEMTKYQPSYYIDSFLWNSPLISEEQAVEDAFEFLSENLKESVLENVTVWGDLVGSQPTWTFIIEGPDLVTQIQVNAITGEIIGWNLSTPSSSRGEPAQLNSTDDVEDIAFEFLKSNNYSIPSTARYIGVNQFPSDTDGIYIEFHHYEGELKIGKSTYDQDLAPDYRGEGITLRVSESYGIVTQFGYRWTKIGPIPTSGLISQTRAETIASRNCSNQDVTIVGSQLSLIEIESYHSSDGSPQRHLSWIVAGNVSSKLWWFYVDAFSGEFLEEHRTNGPVELDWEPIPTSNIVYFIIPVAITLSILIAGVVKHLSNQNET